MLPLYNSIKKLKKEQKSIQEQKEKEFGKTNNLIKIVKQKEKLKLEF